MTNKLVRNISRILAVPIAALTFGAGTLVSPPQVEADEGVYAGVQGDYAEFSDSHVQEVYGNMWGLGVRGGYETKNGLRLEAKLHTARAQGTDTLVDLGAVNFALTTSGVQFRLAKAFDFDRFTPYVGVESSYETLTELLTSELGAVSTGSFPAIGYGAFAGLEVAFSNKQSAHIEVLRNSIPISVFDLGGTTLSFGIKTRF